MNYIHARLFKRSLLVLSVKVAFTLLLPWIRRHEDFYRFTRILCSCTLLPSYAKMPSLFPYPHPMTRLQTSSFRLSPQGGKPNWACMLAHATGTHSPVLTVLLYTQQEWNRISRRGGLSSIPLTVTPGVESNTQIRSHGASLPVSAQWPAGACMCSPQRARAFLPPPWTGDAERGGSEIAPRGGGVVARAEAAVASGADGC
jgi:hypothetical protein